MIKRSVQREQALPNNEQHQPPRTQACEAARRHCYSQLTKTGYFLPTRDLQKLLQRPTFVQHPTKQLFQAPSSLSAEAMPAKVNSKARDEADFWHRAYKPTVEIEYSDEEVVTPRLTPLIPGVQNHLRTLRSRTNTATAEPTPQTTSKLRKEADNTAAKKKAKVAAAAKKADQIVLCKKSGPCEKARVKHEAQGEPHICRCYDSKLNLTTFA